MCGPFNPLLELTGSYKHIMLFKRRLEFASGHLFPPRSESRQGEKPTERQRGMNHGEIDSQ